MKSALVGGPFVVLACLATTTHADRRQADVGLWLEAGASHELGDHVEIEGKQHLRFDRNISRVSSVIPEAGVSYEPWGFLELGTGYRYEYERAIDDEELEVGHRLHVDSELSAEFRELVSSYRWRLQDNVEDRFASPTFRNRLEFEWDREGRWRPAVSAEVFYDIEDGGMEGDKTRLTFEIKIDANQVDTDVFYRADLPDDPMDPTEHIMGLELAAEL